MIESNKPFTGGCSVPRSEAVPSSIKLHGSGHEQIKVVPDANKSHLGDTSLPKIMPNDTKPDINRASNRQSIPLEGNENIKIVP
ncbi:MAG: hypothetical protein ACI4JJ_01470 [Huintestinicola sp.]